LASVKVASQVINVGRKTKRKKMDEFELEIDWIPEDTGAPYKGEEYISDLPAHSIDKLCKKKYGHTNWARMGSMTPEELIGNPCDFDYENGVIFFKSAHMV